MASAMDETWRNPELDESGLEVSGDSIKVDVGKPLIFHQSRVRRPEITPLVFVRTSEGHCHESDLLLDLGGHVDSSEKRSSELVRHDLVIEQVHRSNDGCFATDSFVKGLRGRLFHATISITDRMGLRPHSVAACESLFFIGWAQSRSASRSQSHPLSSSRRPIRVSL